MRNGLLAVAAVLGFVKLADEVVEGSYRDVDRWTMRAVHEHLVGAPDSTVAEIALNVTALGGYPVLTLLLASVIGFLLLSRMAWEALYVFVVTVGGALLSEALKGVFARPRPQAVEHLVDVSSWSFPSGHAMISAVVYLTLGSLIAATATRRLAKLYVLSVSLVLTGVVGVSRILLAVHYPTDVLAGWMAGLAWALVCWVGFEAWERRTRTQRRDPPADAPQT